MNCTPIQWKIWGLQRQFYLDSLNKIVLRVLHTPGENYATPFFKITLRSGFPAFVRTKTLLIFLGGGLFFYFNALHETKVNAVVKLGICVLVNRSYIHCTTEIDTILWQYKISQCVWIVMLWRTVKKEKSLGVGDT